MSVYKKLQKTINECDLEGYLDLLHSDFKKRMDAHNLKYV